MGNKMLNKLTKLIPIQYIKLDPLIKGRSFGVLIQIDEKYKKTYEYLKTLEESKDARDC